MKPENAPRVRVFYFGRSLSRRARGSTSLRLTWSLRPGAIRSALTGRGGICGDLHLHQLQFPSCGVD